MTVPFTASQTSRILEALPMIPKLLAKMAVPHRLHQDLTQAASLGIVRKVKKYQPALGGWYGFAWRVAHWAVQDELRAQDLLTRKYRSKIKRGEAEPPEICSIDSFVEPESGVSHLSYREDFISNIYVDELLRSLPKQQAYVIEQCCLVGAENRKVAERLGCCRRTVWKLKQQGLAALRDLLQEGA